MRRRRHRPPPSPISRSAIALIPFSPSLAALPEGAGEAAAPPNPRPSEEDRASRSQMRSATPHPHDPGHAPLIHPPPPSILRKSHRDVEALLTDRTHLEAVVKIQQEFWLHRDGVLRDRLDETRRVEDCLRRGDAAKLDLLLGKKDLEVRRHRIYIGLIGEIYDDMSLPNGVLRLQRKGGHGRHNGLQNVIEHLDGCREFPRLSIGIGSPPGKMDTRAFLLQKFSSEERIQIDTALEQGVDAVRTLVLKGFSGSIERFNLVQKYKFNRA